MSCIQTKIIWKLVVFASSFFFCQIYIEYRARCVSKMVKSYTNFYIFRSSLANSKSKLQILIIKSDTYINWIPFDSFVHKLFYLTFYFIYTFFSLLLLYYYIMIIIREEKKKICTMYCCTLYLSLYTHAWTLIMSANGKFKPKKGNEETRVCICTRDSLLFVTCELYLCVCVCILN